MSRWDGFLKNSVKNEEQISSLRSWMKELFSPAARPTKLLVLAGQGPCGKSMLLKLLAALVGEEKSLDRLPNMKKPFGVAELKGKRLIFLDAEEANIGKILARVKALLGGDKLVCRERYKETELFTPECSVACAVQAVELDDDLAMWNRVLKIDMTPVAVCDPVLLGDLLAEAEEIKGWALSL